MIGTSLATRVLAWMATSGLLGTLLVVDGRLAAQSPSPQQAAASPSAPMPAARDLPRVRTAFMGARDPSKEVLISIETDGAILHGGQVKVPASQVEPQALMEAYLSILGAARQAQGRTIESRRLNGNPIDIVVDPVRLQAAPKTPWVRVVQLLKACCRLDLGFIHIDFAVAASGSPPSAGQGDEGTYRYTIPVGHEDIPVVPLADPQTKDIAPHLEGLELVLAGKNGGMKPASGKSTPTPAETVAPDFLPQWTLRLSPDSVTDAKLRRFLGESALGQLPMTFSTLDEVVKQFEVLAKDPKAMVNWDNGKRQLLPVTIQPAPDAPLELILQAREAVLGTGFSFVHF